ncbi:hypothetical protein K432DRAFT_109261 [Lepidopterella palustris CBS 459.81]|uniref:Uncharacterized protein n=1 Tax=Lepidopterella palustris CBS 459.81 TaxID=1314670 RepID=A0A8E2E5K2_9PEZI|nr:hypothetical protein K432DRAFT_109261 [Lepidopterella palustris CBS 459.81]
MPESFPFFFLFLLLFCFLSPLCIAPLERGRSIIGIGVKNSLSLSDDNFRHSQGSLEAFCGIFISPIWGFPCFLNLETIVHIWLFLSYRDSRKTSPLFLGSGLW